MKLPVEVEESLYKQGIKYDVLIHNRNCPTHIRHGTLICHARSINGAKIIINRYRKNGIINDYEVKEHIYPWDSFFESLRKTLKGTIYYENDVDIAREKERQEIQRFKEEIGKK